MRLAQGSSDRNHINDWARRFSYVPGQRAGADWNFETPNMVPSSMIPSLVQMPEAMKRELYEYPSRISTVAEAERAQKLRMQASEADHDRVFGRSASRVAEVGRLLRYGGEYPGLAKSFRAHQRQDPWSQQVVFAF